MNDEEGCSTGWCERVGGRVREGREAYMFADFFVRVGGIFCMRYSEKGVDVGGRRWFG